MATESRVTPRVRAAVSFTGKAPDRAFSLSVRTMGLVGQYNEPAAAAYLECARSSQDLTKKNASATLPQRTRTGPWTSIQGATLPSASARA